MIINRLVIYICYKYFEQNAHVFRLLKMLSFKLLCFLKNILLVNHLNILNMHVRSRNVHKSSGLISIIPRLIIFSIFAISVTTRKSDKKNKTAFRIGDCTRCVYISCVYFLGIFHCFSVIALRQREYKTNFANAFGVDSAYKADLKSELGCRGSIEISFVFDVRVFRSFSPLPPPPPPPPATTHANTR